MAKRDAERSFGPVKSAPEMWSLGGNSLLVREVLDAVSRWLNRI
jgi:cytidylate kinase